MALFKKENEKGKRKNELKKDSSVVGDAVKVLSGVVAGVATALLLAPQSGKETRSKLKESANELGENVSDKSKEFGKVTKDQVNNLKDQVKEKAKS
jgi:gas vesicle protein